MFKNPVFCALDTPDIETARTMAAQVRPYVGGLKIGMEYFYAHGRAGYEAVAAAKKPIFLDLKLHDIPNTVASAIRALSPLKPTILNVHAGGGGAMMRAAVKAVKTSESPMKLIGVSVLTSLDETDLAQLGVKTSVSDHVKRLGALAKDCGLDGMVCSAHEIETLRGTCGPDFMLIVPGIRPAGAAVGDQKRIMSPTEALERGADILVIGRPITKAENSAQAAAMIAREIEAAKK